MSAKAEEYPTLVRRRRPDPPPCRDTRRPVHEPDRGFVADDAP
jgi:hypothetical protein